MQPAIHVGTSGWHYEPWRGPFYPPKILSAAMLDFYAERLATFLAALPRGHRCAMEFRDPSWFAPEVYRLLERHNVALCAFDLAGEESPQRVTADFAYLRLHGPAGEKYCGCYSKAQLRARVEKCRDWIQQGAREVFVYFDNDQAGYGAANAREFQSLAAA